MKKIKNIQGHGIPLRGADIDTDRIMPARYLKELTFDNLGKYIFHDEIVANTKHAFNNPKYKSANILFVNANFGCGSSREHAPQGIKRWGIECIIGESFSEIFYSNCVSIGLPCFTLESKNIAGLQAQAEEDPSTEFLVDLETKQISFNQENITLTMDDSVQQSFIKGEWDITDLLLKSDTELQSKHKSLPY